MIIWEEDPVSLGSEPELQDASVWYGLAAAREASLVESNLGVKAVFTSKMTFIQRMRNGMSAIWQQPPSRFSMPSFIRLVVLGQVTLAS